MSGWFYSFMRTTTQVKFGLYWVSSSVLFPSPVLLLNFNPWWTYYPLLRWAKYLSLSWTRNPGMCDWYYLTRFPNKEIIWVVHIGMSIQDSVQDIAIKRETYQTYFWMKDATYLLIFHDNSAMANEKNPGNQSLHRFKDDPSVRESSEILTRVESIQISDPSPIHLIGIHRHSKLVFLK